MEEGAEKMAALKRAYADIILNTAKESAVRVLAAERRALGFQQSLFTSKEEALATMIRLKALMEDKIREAEKTTLCQAKKIEELELQLGEAEDTIVDLREELKRVREELTLMRSCSFKLFSEEIRNDTCMVCNNVVKEKSTDNLDELENRSTVGNFKTISSPKTGDTHQCCLKNVEKAEHRKEFSLKDDCAGTTDLASIIWSSKVPELYRKGHTQRIHALEHDLTTKVSLSESNGLQISSKSELLTCSSVKHQIVCKADSTRSDKRTVLVKDTSIFANTEQQPGYHKSLETKHEAGCFKKDHFTLSNWSSPREHRPIYSHSNVSSYSIFSNKSKSCSSCSEVTVHDKQNEIEALKETPVPFVHEAMEISGTAEDKMVFADISTEREALKFNQCIDTSIKKESMEIKQCTKNINWQSVQKQNQFVYESKSLTSFQNDEDVKDSLLIKAFPKTGGPTFSVTIQKDLKNQLEDAVALKPEVDNAPESSAKCNIVNPDTKVTENGNAHAETDKFLKYTFQRKRKKGSSPIKNEIMFPEKRSTLKSNSADKQNSLSAPSKSSVVTDLPRNNRRLVQVARQLISLSEKRW